MVDYGPLVLGLLTTPRTVGIAHKMLEGVTIMYSLQSHDLWGFQGWALLLGTSALWVVNEENSWHV